MKTKSIKRDGYILNVCIHHCKYDELKIKGVNYTFLYVKENNPNIFKIIRYLDKIVEYFCWDKSTLAKTNELLFLYREMKKDLGVNITKRELELEFGIKETTLKKKLHLGNSGTKPDEFMMVLLKFDSLLNRSRRFKLFGEALRLSFLFSV